MVCEQRYLCSGLAPIFSRLEPYRTCLGTFEATTFSFDAFDATRSYEHFLSLWNELRTQYAESLVFSIYSRMDNNIQTNGLRH